MSGLPKGWVEATLGELGSWQGGGTPDKSNAKYWSSGTIPWVSPKDMKRFRISEAEDQITEEALAGSSTNIVAENSVLIVTRSGILKHTLPVALTGSEVAINQDIKALTPHPELDALFVAQQIKSLGSFILTNCTKAGTTVDSVDFDRLKLVNANVPPLAEQKRIVAKLDTLNTKSARARTELARIETLVSRYKQAMLSKAFSGELTQEWRTSQQHARVWPDVTISDIADVVTGSTPKTAEKDRYFGGATPFFKPTDLDQGYYVKTPRETLSADGVAVSRLVSAKSVLVTCIGATIGKVGFARVACCTNQQINALVPNGAKTVPEWLYWTVLSPEFQTLILANSSATTLPIINKGRFQQLPLALPSLDEQREIVRRIEFAFYRINRLAAESRRALNLVGKLDEAILAKAFCGELVPQDENDEPAEKLLERIRAERAAAPKEKTRTVRRKTTMLTARDFLNAKLQNWPEDGVSFQDLRREFSGSYEDLKEAIFASLSDEKSTLQQIFDEKTSMMTLRKLER